MTFAQLRAFVTIARCGSVKSAALEMKVSQAAVSQAIFGLREEFDDELYVRDGRVASLTPRGRQLAGIGAEILGLAEHARRTGGDAHGTPGLLRIVATGTVAEYIIPSVVEAFARRRPNLKIQVAVDSPASFRELLRLRRADVAVGPDPINEAGIECVPFLRYELVVVGGREDAVAPGDEPGLPRDHWVLGPNDTDGVSEVGRFFTAANAISRGVRVYPSHAAAAAAAVSGRGMTLAVAHTVVDELGRGMLVRIPMAGTPVTGMWYATTLAAGQAPAAAVALRRYVTTPEATHAALAGGGIPPGRSHPPIHITLWSGISARGDGGEPVASSRDNRTPVTTRAGG